MIKVVGATTKRELAVFAEYPLKLYRGCPYYVPSFVSDDKFILDEKKNFSLRLNKCRCFLAYRDGEPVGRIAGLINYKYNEISGKKYIRFSRFDCIDDEEVFSALLGAVESFGKENGMEYMHGPWGFNDTDREGMLTYGFDRRSTYATNYFYPYFYKRMEELGFEAESKWLEKKFVVPKETYGKIDSLALKLKNKLELRDLSETMSVRAIMKNYGDSFFDTFNESYRNLDCFVPIEGEAKKKVLSQFGTIANRRYISVLADKEDKVVAFSIVLPSIAEALQKSRGRLFPLGFLRVLNAIKRPRELEMALIGIRDNYKNTGVNSIMISKICKNIIADGIKDIESNPMLETNFNIQRQWKFSENEVIKKRQTYVKRI